MAKKHFFPMITGLIATVFIISLTFVSLGALPEDLTGTYRVGSDDRGVIISSEFLANANANVGGSWGDQRPSDFTLTITEKSISFSFTARNTVYSETFSHSYHAQSDQAHFILNADNKRGTLSFNPNNNYNGLLTYTNSSTGKQYWIELHQLSKDANVKPVFHHVTIVTRYLDQARPEQSNTYQVEHGATFSTSFDVLDGYDIYGTTLFNQLAFDVDMDTRTVSLQPVDKDYLIELDFDKIEHRVQLITQYTDQSQAENTHTDWVRHGESYDKTITIAEGYHITNIDQLPQGVYLNDSDNTIMIDSVVEDQEIILIFAKKYYPVTIKIVYEDNTHDDVIINQDIYHGDEFKTDFIIEQGCKIKKINFNAEGVTVNKNEHFISINSVTDSIDIVIYVR